MSIFDIFCILIIHTFSFIELLNRGRHSALLIILICQFGQDSMGSIPATPSMKHASCFPPSVCTYCIFCIFVIFCISDILCIFCILPILNILRILHILHISDLFMLCRYILLSSQPVYGFWYYFMIRRAIGIHLQKILPKLVPKTDAEADALLDCKLRVYVVHILHILHI